MAMSQEEKERREKNTHAVEELNEIISRSLDNPDIQKLLQRRGVSLPEMQQILYNFAEVGWRVIHVHNNKTGDGKYEILNPDKSDGLVFDYNSRTGKVTHVYIKS